MDLVEPTGGSVHYKGRDLLTLSGQEMRKEWRTIQTVFQDPYASLHPRRTVSDIVREPWLVHTGVAPRKHTDRAPSEDPGRLPCLPSDIHIRYSRRSDTLRSFPARGAPPIATGRRARPSSGNRQGDLPPGTARNHAGHSCTSGFGFDELHAAAGAQLTSVRRPLADERAPSRTAGAGRDRGQSTTRDRSADEARCAGYECSASVAQVRVARGTGALRRK